MRLIDVTQPPYNADPTCTSDAYDIIQAANDDLEAQGGGYLWAPGHFRLRRGIVSDDHNVVHIGAGGGYHESSSAEIIGSAGSRYFVDPAIAESDAAVLSFISPAGGRPKAGGGVRGIMLDSGGLTKRNLEILSRRNGVVEDVLLWRATDAFLYTGSIAGALATVPYVTMGWHFSRVRGTAKMYPNSTAVGAHLTGGQADGATKSGNTCFNRFDCVYMDTMNNHAWLYEDSDSNVGTMCRGAAANPAFYGLVFGSKDQDSSGNPNTPGHARDNQHFGGSFERVWLRASQTGKKSSENNLILGNGVTNGLPVITVETPLNGSLAPSSPYLDARGEFNRVRLAANGELQFGSGGPKIINGVGAPPASLIAPLNTLYLRSDNAGQHQRAYLSLGGGQWTALMTTG